MYKVFEFITELIGAIMIVASPTIIGLGIGFLIYTKYPSNIGLTIAGLVVFISLLAGLFLAIKIWKKYGTIWFLSRTSATPDLDNKEE